MNKKFFLISFLLSVLMSTTVQAQNYGPNITLEQAKQYDLPSNPAKETSSRFREYVKRTGTNRCWEVEALEPDILRKCVHDAILKVVDVDQLNAVQERQAQERQDIADIRVRVGTKLQDLIEEEQL